MGTVAVRREIQIPTLAEVIAIASIYAKKDPQISPCGIEWYLCAAIVVAWGGDHSSPPRGGDLTSARTATPTAREHGPKMGTGNQRLMQDRRGSWLDPRATCDNRRSKLKQRTTPYCRQCEGKSGVGAGCWTFERERERTVLRDRRSGEERRRMIKS